MVTATPPQVPDTAFEIVEIAPERAEIVLRAPASSPEAERVREAAIAVTPRASVLLSRADDGAVLAHLRAKDSNASEAALLDLANELATAATWAVWRARLKGEHGERITEITKGALAVVMSPPAVSPSAGDHDPPGEETT